jgi:hypothetical protein
MSDLPWLTRHQPGHFIGCDIVAEDPISYERPLPEADTPATASSVSAFAQLLRSKDFYKLF